MNECERGCGAGGQGVLSGEWSTDAVARIDGTHFSLWRVVSNLPAHAYRVCRKALGMVAKGALLLAATLALLPNLALSQDAKGQDSTSGNGLPVMSAEDLRYVYFYDDIMTLATEYHGYVTRGTFEKVFQVKFSKVVYDKDGGYVATLEGELSYGISARLQVTSAKGVMQRWERNVGARKEPRSVLNISGGTFAHMYQAKLNQMLKDKGFHELGTLQGTNMMGAKTVFSLPDRAGSISFYWPTFGMSSGDVNSVEIIGYLAHDGRD
jgi:hypothetical protein